MQALNEAALQARWGRRLVLPGRTSDVRPAVGEACPGQPIRLLGSSASWLTVHSARQPEREAARWLDDTLAGRALPSAVCVIGAGLGFVVDVIEARSTTTRVLILEPEPGLVPHLLARRDWRPLIAQGRLLVLAGPNFDGAAEAWRVLDGEDEPLILSHPVVVRERREAAVAAARVLQRARTDWMSNRNARNQLGERYLHNTLLNLAQFGRAGDVRDIFGKCAGVPAIVAGAGPSLNRNLDDLRAVGDVRNRAIMISVDTAVRPCLAAGLAPDFAVAVDASAANARHLTELPDTGDTWLVAEPSIDPSSFEAFAGRTLLFRIADHDPWPFLHAVGIDRSQLAVWGSVLTAATDLALRLGCDPIIFVGADLAYTNGQPYCWGTIYDRDWAYGQSQGYALEELWRTWMKQPAIHVHGVEGQSTRTAAHLIAFRDWLLDLSVSRQPRRFINATGAGVLHGGTFSQERAVDALASAGKSARRPRRSWTLGTAPQAHDEHLAERLLSTGLTSQTWGRALGGETGRALASELMARVDRSELSRLEQVPAHPLARKSIDAITERSEATQSADEDLTRTLLDLTASGCWREWPVIERVRFVNRVCALYARDRSPLGREVYPDLVEIFQAALVSELHPGLASTMYDQLHWLCWTVRSQPSDLLRFTTDVVEPMRQHARAWASRLDLGARRKLGSAPTKIGYLGYNCHLSQGHTVARAVWALLEGHAALRSAKLTCTYYAWRNVDEAFRRALDAIGVALRVVDWPNAPCSALASLRAAIASDGVDVLLTDQNLGLPTVLFETRSAPVQIFLDMGFPAWSPELADYSFLGMTADPRELGLPPSKYEHIVYPEDPLLQETAVAAARRVEDAIDRLVRERTA